MASPTQDRHIAALELEHNHTLNLIGDSSSLAHAQIDLPAESTRGTDFG